MKIRASVPSYEFLKDLYCGLRSRILRSKLRLYYDPSITPDKDRVVTADYRWACFYHLAVLNTSRYEALECQGILLDVTPIGFPEGYQHWLKKPEILKWANETDYYTISIKPGQKRRLDFVYVFHDDPRFRFFFKRPDPPVGNMREFPSGQYEATVRIAQKTGPKVEETFLVSGDGTWDRVTITQLSRPDA